MTKDHLIIDDTEVNYNERLISEAKIFAITALISALLFATFIPNKASWLYSSFFVGHYQLSYSVLELIEQSAIIQILMILYLLICVTASIALGGALRIFKTKIGFTAFILYALAGLRISQLIAYLLLL